VTDRLIMQSEGEVRLRRWLAYTLFGCTLIGVVVLGTALHESQEAAHAAQIKADKQTLRTELVVASSPYALIMCNELGEIVLSNYAAEVLLGYGHRDLIGMPTTSLMPEDKRARHIVGMQRASARMKAYKEGDWVLILENAEFDALHKSGVLVPVTVSIRVIRFMGDVEFVVTMTPRVEEADDKDGVTPETPLPVDEAVPLPEIGEGNLNIERAKSVWAASR
jgi:PAS domain S-box-containing protein